MKDESISERLQKPIKGKILEFQYGEFHEQVVISKPVHLKSTISQITIVGATPTVSIFKRGVILENINIICPEEKGICLRIKKDTDPNFINVYVKGNVEGVNGEQGIWDIPDSLELAVIPDIDTTNVFTIYSPVHATIYPKNISAVSCSPTKIKPGLNTIILKISDIQKGCLLNGYLIIETELLHLKRRIALIGDTFNPNPDDKSCEGKLLWKCKCPLNLAILSSLPIGTQNVFFDFILNEELLGSKDYKIKISNLPIGLILSEKDYPRKITGIPKVTGEFTLNILFENSTDIWEHSTILTIEEKKIVPLTIRGLVNPLIFKINEPINVQIDILTSNSSDISVVFEPSLPSILSFDGASRELTGIAKNPGKISFTALISDDCNVINTPLNFFFIPETQLQISSAKEFTVLVGDDFCFPIILDHFLILDIEAYIPDPTFSNSVKIKKSSDKCLLTGNFDNPGEYNFEVLVRDCFDREIKEKFQLKCNNKPDFIFTWPKNPVVILGKAGSRFSEPIQARVNQNISASIQYFCKSILPGNIVLDQNGQLSGLIEREYKFNITIEALYNEFSFVNVFRVEIRVLKETVAVVKKQGSLPSVWGVPILEAVDKDHDTEQPKYQTVLDSEKASKDLPENKLPFINHQDYEIADNLKSQLDIAYLNIKYQCDLIIDAKYVDPKTVEVRNLPKGMLYEKINGVISGAPATSGDFSIEIFNLNGKLIKTSNLKVENRKKAGKAFE